MNMKIYYTPKEVTKMLGIKYRNLRTIEKTFSIPIKRSEGTHIKYHVTDLDKIKKGITAWQKAEQIKSETQRLLAQTYGYKDQVNKSTQTKMDKVTMDAKKKITKLKTENKMMMRELDLDIKRIKRQEQLKLEELSKAVRE